MLNGTHPFAQAENLRKEGRYPQAAQIFATLWQQQPDPRVGWRLAFCQRKQGRLDQAEAVARKALELAPGDPYIQSELGWVLYERYIKPARETGDLGRALYGARQILDLNPQGLLLKLVSQAMMKVGKDRGQWAVVEEWSARLDPADLDKEAREINGKKTMSEREVWYVQRARALLELGRYQEALETAQAGLQDFPDEFFLQRIAAQAQRRTEAAWARASPSFSACSITPMRTGTYLPTWLSWKPVLVNRMKPIAISALHCFRLTRGGIQIGLSDGAGRPGGET